MHGDRSTVVNYSRASPLILWVACYCTKLNYYNLWITYLLLITWGDVFLTNLSLIHSSFHVLLVLEYSCWKMMHKFFQWQTSMVAYWPRWMVGFQGLNQELSGWIWSSSFGTTHFSCTEKRQIFCIYSQVLRIRK